jgi:hypothetical protein
MWMLLATANRLLPLNFAVAQASVFGVVVRCVCVCVCATLCGCGVVE